MGFLRRLPTEERAWDTRTRRWSIAYHHLEAVLLEGARCFAGTSIDGFDAAWRARAEQILRRPLDSARGERAYDELFILPNAPLPVVRAAYRALARIYHPDTGGSTARMADLNRAYERVLALRRRHA